jgi:hypothetical protein
MNEGIGGPIPASSEKDSIEPVALARAGTTGSVAEWPRAEHSPRRREQSRIAREAKEREVHRLLGQDRT